MFARMKEVLKHLLETPGVAQVIESPAKAVPIAVIGTMGFVIYRLYSEVTVLKKDNKESKVAINNLQNEKKENQDEINFKREQVADLAERCSNISDALDHFIEARQRQNERFNQLLMHVAAREEITNPTIQTTAANTRPRSNSVPSLFRYSNPPSLLLAQNDESPTETKERNREVKL